MNQIEHHQDARAEEQALIDKAARAVKDSDNKNWDIGECASQWTERYARGKTDVDFANLIGTTADRVTKCRQVWEVFGDVQKADPRPELSWTHYREAMHWDDAPEVLAWAADNAASVRNMVRWRDIQHAEDQRESEEDDDADREAERSKASVDRVCEDVQTKRPIATGDSGGENVHDKRVGVQPVRKRDEGQTEGLTPIAKAVDLDKLWDTLSQLVEQAIERNTREERLLCAAKLKRLIVQLEAE